MAWLARCENGSRAPWVTISFSTCSSELAFQNLFRKSAERLRMLTLLATLTRIRYQVTSDIRIRMMNRLLPTKSLCATKCRKPMSGVAMGAGAAGSAAAAPCSASADCWSAPAACWAASPTAEAAWGAAGAAAAAAGAAAAGAAGLVVACATRVALCSALDISVPHDEIERNFGFGG